MLTAAIAVACILVIAVLTVSWVRRLMHPQDITAARRR